VLTLLVALPTLLMTPSSSLLWFSLFAVVGVAIVVDLLIHRRSHPRMSLRRALIETGVWIGLALLFNLWILYAKGHQSAVEFLTGYLVEETLSIDNLFLFLIIFRSFQVSPVAQHRVLYYGVAGAIIFRILFILGGIKLLNRFEFIIYVFGAILLFTAVRMVWPHDDENVKEPWIVGFTRNFFPVTEQLHGRHFFVRQNGRWLATPLFLALVAIELVDVIFAVDSVPAVLAITRDPFVAYSSNLFAVLGLRAIYFALAGFLTRFRFLHQGLAVVLVFVGAKMLLSHHVSISANLSLAVIVTVFAVTVAASLLWPAPSRN